MALDFALHKFESHPTTQPALPDLMNCPAQASPHARTCPHRAHNQVNLKVREHKVLGPYVEGLRSFATKDFGAMNALILEGIKSRMTAATAMNDQSPRSHAVFNIQLTASTFDTMSGNTGEKTSRISLVDLAGSERVRCLCPTLTTSCNAINHALPPSLACMVSLVDVAWSECAHCCPQLLAY